jgi:hypothetical protein
MAYDPRLDNNYRISGDRIISERTAQNEAAAGLLADLVAMPPKLRFYLGMLGLLAAAGLFFTNFPDEKFDSVGFWFYCIIGGGIVLAAWGVSYALAPLILYVGAIYLTYHITESIGLCLVTLIVFPILSHKITNALEHLGEAQATSDSAGEASPSARPMVGRGVKIFAAVTLGSLALLIAWAAYEGLTHRVVRQKASSPVVAATAPVKSTGKEQAAANTAVLNDHPTVEPTRPSATGADAVEAFYSALGRGDGNKANSLMSLEKRAAPAYQPDAIEAFYGHMAEPLTLVSVSEVGATDYEVRYRYRKQSAVCNGHAIVTTQDSGGRAVIARIKPIGNC